MTYVFFYQINTALISILKNKNKKMIIKFVCI